MLLNGTVLKTDIQMEELSDFVQKNVFQVIASSGKPASELFASFPMSDDLKADQFDKIVCTLAAPAFLRQKMCLYSLCGALGVARCLKQGFLTAASASCLSIFAFSLSFTLKLRKISYDLGFNVAIPVLRRRSGAAKSLDSVVPICVSLSAQWGPNINEALPLLGEVEMELCSWSL